MQLAGAAGRGCRFLVAGRVDAKKAFMTLADVAVPPQLQRMVRWPGIFLKYLTMRCSWPGIFLSILNANKNSAAVLGLKP